MARIRGEMARWREFKGREGPGKKGKKRDREGETAAMTRQPMEPMGRCSRHRG